MLAKSLSASKHCVKLIKPTVLPCAQKRTLRQRRFKNEFKDPYKLIQDYREKMNVIPRLDDPGVPVMKPIVVKNYAAEKQIKLFDDAKKQGKTVLDHMLAEEPDVEQYIKKLKLKRPEYGKEYVPGVSKRAGVIAVKVGMMPMWDPWYTRLPITALKIYNCQVIQVKTEENDGYDAVQVGAGPINIKKVTKPLMGHFAKSGVEPKHIVGEFRVSKDCLLQVGQEISARHFLPGQYVDVKAVSKGKGFQGVMKRYGFSGQPATHGVSVVHRSVGSIGSTDRVFKGKKMPGRMGGTPVTKLNCYVHGIDIQENVIFVKGSVPGSVGSYVVVRDAHRKEFDVENLPPFPTFVPPEGEDVSTLSDKESLLVGKGRKPFWWYDIDHTDEEIASKLAAIRADEREEQ